MSDADCSNRKEKGKFASLPSPQPFESSRKVAFYPWDDDDPVWEDLKEDVDETVARDIDEMNGDMGGMEEITKDERDRQMRQRMLNAHRNKYLRVAHFHWKKVCVAYRKKAKSLKKKLSLLDQCSFDQNGDFAPNKLCSRFSQRMNLVSCFCGSRCGSKR